jgi:uncharacterized membrane-anchored protein YhcB (DUF1043 family)
LTWVIVLTGCVVGHFIGAVVIFREIRKRLEALESNHLGSGR